MEDTADGMNLGPLEILSKPPAMEVRGTRQYQAISQSPLRVGAQLASATGSSLDILYVGTLPPHPGGSAILGSHLPGGLAKLGNSVRALAPITAEALQGGDRFALRHPSIAVRRFLIPRFETAPKLGRKCLAGKPQAHIRDRRRRAVPGNHGGSLQEKTDLGEL